MAKLEQEISKLRVVEINRDYVLRLEDEKRYVQNEDMLENLDTGERFNIQFEECEYNDTDEMTVVAIEKVKIKTPRGTFKIAEQFKNSKDAKESGYYIYFTDDDGITDIYTKHLDEYHCLFGIVERSR